jgi:hypothetical protein
LGACFDLGAGHIHGSQSILAPFDFFGQVCTIGGVGLIGFLSLLEQDFYFGLELCFDL